MSVAPTKPPHAASAPPVPLHPPGRTGFPPTPMRWEDVRDMRGLPHEAFEYVDGYAVEQPVARLAHAQLRTWLLHIGQSFIESTSYGTCEGEPFAIRIPDGNRRMPDVFFWPKTVEVNEDDHAIEEPADLVIEILSPSTREIDFGPKYEEYEAAGCREYWILDPEPPHRHLFHVLRGGHYRPLATERGEDGSETIRSTSVPGLWFDVAWFASRPPAAAVLAAWAAARAEG